MILIEIESHMEGRGGGRIVEMELIGFLTRKIFILRGRKDLKDDDGKYIDQIFHIG